MKKKRGGAQSCPRSDHQGSKQRRQKDRKRRENFPHPGFSERAKPKNIAQMVAHDGKMNEETAFKAKYMSEIDKHVPSVVTATVQSNQG